MDTSQTQRLCRWLAQFAIVSFTVLLAACTPTPVSTPSPPPPRPDQEQAFVQEMEQLRQMYDIPGLSIVVVRDQQIVLATGLGYADLEHKIPATADTAYPIGSLTKPIAATLLMHLVETRQIDLDRPMADILKDTRFELSPTFVLHGYAERCAQIQAAPDNFSDSEQQYRPLFEDYRCDTEAITVRHHLTHTAQGVPGETFRYNGMLYGMLAQAMEAATTEPFEKLLSDTIFSPLEMNSTIPDVNASQQQSQTMIAPAYHLNAAGELSPSICSECKGLNAGSGIVSTVNDLATFDVALDQDRLVSAQSKAAMFTPTLSNKGTVLPYGEGWFVQTYQETNVVWHYSWLPQAYSGLILKVPQQNVTLILLANSDGLSAPFDLDKGDIAESPFAAAFLTHYADVPAVTSR